MRERAQAIGGTLEVDTAPGAGTRIVAHVPREAA
jgi:signal transduction histidine kinase